jgi:hypothetical protein
MEYKDYNKYVNVYSSYPYKKMRIGKYNDGGYILCDIPNIKYNLLISCGIGNDISFEEDFTKKYNVKCYAFDGTINKMPETKNENITWIKKNISSITNESNTNLKYLLSNKNIFLKMDIETYEYDWLSSITENELLNISQLVIEFHFPFTNTIDSRNISDKLSCLEKLAKTHYIVHFHPNNCCGTTQYLNTTFPNIFECTYLRKDYFIREPFRNIRPIPDPYFDSKNVLYNPDIILNDMPFIDKKTIIFSMTHTPKNFKPYNDNIGNNMWGIGDVVRGLIGLYKYCKTNNFYFYIDAQNHLLNKYLDISYNPYKEFVKEKSEDIYFLPASSKPDDYINNYDKNEPVCLFTNMCFDDIIDDSDKNFIKQNFLIPKPVILERIKELISGNIYDYEILHCRLGDNEFIYENDHKKYQSIYEYVKKHINEKTILLCNSIHFKNYVRKNYPKIRQFETKTAHLGYQNSSKEGIIDTLSELFIMTRANKIYTFSEYGHMSGFTKIANDIYDIPVLDIKRI